MPSILLIEDDPAIRRELVEVLRGRGHAIATAPNGMDGLRLAVDERPDVVLLDLGLPDLDGGTVLTMLRAVSDVPVVVVTARDGDANLVRALDAGADDYVVKPFTVEHLDARLRAVLRRTNASPDRDEVLRVGGLEIDARARTACLAGTELDLSRKEFDLLHLLARRAGEVVSKRELLAEVWHQAWGGGDRTVEVHLSWLRRKLGENAAHPRYLHSVRGVGIVLKAPPSP
ncbi:MAG TPA: response regulator transcription factor [Actinomycetes bacterium]|nr:response regulator transcription factor [Actinomycetes bacterium]